MGRLFRLARMVNYRHGESDIPPDMAGKRYRVRDAQTGEVVPKVFMVNPAAGTIGRYLLNEDGRPYFDHQKNEVAAVVERRDVLVEGLEPGES